MPECLRLTTERKQDIGEDYLEATVQQPWSVECARDGSALAQAPSSVRAEISTS